MRHSGGLKTGLSQDAWKVWGLKPLSKQCGSGFAEIHSGNRRSWAEHIDPINVTPHQGWSTHENAPPFKGTHPYSCFKGDPMDKSRVSPPVACQEWARKHCLHGQEHLHHQRAVQPPEPEDLCSNVPWGEGKFSEGAGRPSPFLCHGLVGGVPSRGDTSSLLQERDETGVWVYREDVLQVVKHLNMSLFSDQEWVF